ARAAAMAAAIIGLHVLGWGMLAAAAGGHYHITGTQLFGFGTGVLAYTLGIRHAFDADHIAAIDNTTRKLAGDGQWPLSAGLFFSRGHSTVVFALAGLLNLGIRALIGDDACGGGAGGQRDRGVGQLGQVAAVHGELADGADLAFIDVQEPSVGAQPG